MMGKRAESEKLMPARRMEQRMTSLFTIWFQAGGEGSGDLVLHNLDRSRSYRVIWLLEELGIPFEIKQYNRDPSGPNPVENGFKIHPLGRAQWSFPPDTY